MTLRPRRSSRSAALIVVALIASVASAAAAVPAAHAAPAVSPGSSACDNPNGVTVVIDFGPLGGGVQKVCAGVDPGSGLDALHKAGVAYQEPVRFPGMVCKIAGLPTDAGCFQAPPADAYWSYWHAARGGQWVYANLGPGNRNPPPGSFEGWRFFRRSESQPTVVPPGSEVTTTTTTAPPAPPVTGPPASPGDGGGGTPAPPGGSGTPDSQGAANGPGIPAPGASGAAPTTTVAGSMPGSDKDDKGGKSTSKSDGPITTTQGVAVMGKETATDGDVDGDRTEGRFAGAIDLSDDGSSPGSPLPAIAVVAVVVALGAWRMIVLARRRRAEAAAGS